MRDVTRWPSWTPSVTAVELLDGPGFSVGSRVRIKQPKFPPAVWQVAELGDQSRHFTWESRAPGFQVSGHHRVEPDGAGSRVTLALEFTGMLGALWARATKDIAMRYMEMEARGLKAESEAGAGGAGTSL